MTLYKTQMKAWRRRDTFPQLRAAGKVLPPSDGAKTCLQEITPRPVTPPTVRKYIRSNRPDPGTVRVFHGKADDPDVASRLVHGIKSPPHTPSGHLINPPPKTQYQEKLQDLKEAYYESRCKAPLGSSQLKGPGLPDWIVPEKTTFGKTISISKGDSVINPPKTAEQVEKEALEAHNLYLRSHNSYLVGERVNRGYDPTTFSRDSRFGVSTPHSNEGRNASRCFQWPSDTRISETSKLPREHTSGVPNRDRTGDRDLLRSSRDYTPRRCVIAARQHLKKAGFQKFSFLLQAFRHYDKTGTGMIGKTDLKDVCRAFDLDLSGDDLDCLIDLCEEDKDGHVDFEKFTHLINWKDKLLGDTPGWRVLNKEHTTMNSLETSEPRSLEPIELRSPRNTSKEQRRPEEGQDHFITTSSVICGVVGGIPTTDYHTFGIPTMRTDLPAPRVQRVSDRVNYGDQGTAGTLLHPTVHSHYGVSEKHFFAPRTKEEMVQIVQNVGLNITEQTFEEAWNLASMRHSRGEVCVESFRNVLKELRAH